MDTRMSHHPSDQIQGDTALQDAQYEVATPGLQNNVGEYNCFLNCILQCLWHCEEFRERMQRLDMSLFKVSHLPPASI